MSRTVGIVGLGLIGGSMAIDLKRRGYADTVLGVEDNPVNAAAARERGLADEIVSFEDCCDRSDIVVLAVPVGIAIRLLGAVLGRWQAAGATGKTVTDVCSVKTDIVRSVEGHPLRGRYVPTHPMAGTEYSGPWAALPDLFDDRVCIFADSAESDPDAVEAIQALYGALKMRPTYMDAASHDLHTAYVSHISHVTSFALALTVLDKERNEHHIFDLASGGFASTVRLAKSSADMWVPVLVQNRTNMLEVIDTYIEKMKLFREAIDGRDGQQLEALIHDANRIQKIIK